MTKKVSILIFVIFISMLYVGLSHNSRLVQSPLIDKKLPEFSLPVLQSDISADISVFPDDIFLLNIWASWCITCQIEHPYLMSLNKRGIPVIGINYKDERDDAINWLSKFGNPYQLIIHDNKGSLALDMGVTGAPETFLVNNGKIVAHYQGEINASIWNKVFAPIIEEQGLFK